VAHDLDLKLVPELWSPAARAIFGSKTMAVLKGHTDVVLSASFSPDGRRILTTSKDRTARVWDADSGKQIALLNAHEETLNSALFSPDGRRIVTTSADGTARVWNAESGEEIATWKAEVGEGSRPGREWCTAAFSPDGRRVWTASGDAAEIWDADTRKKVGCFRFKGLPFRAASLSDRFQPGGICLGCGERKGDRSL
jgi:WD40 repeat protein